MATKESVSLRLALSDEAVRKAVGLSQRAVARELGISARSLMRYLRGERRPPEAIALRLQVLAEDRAPEIESALQARAERDEVIRPDVRKVPVAAHRYQRPPSLIGPSERSEIIVVNVKGLNPSEVGEIVKAYWRELRRTQTDWNIRFQINVSVASYFDGERPYDPHVRKSIRGRSRISLWIPPQHFAFVRRRGRHIESIVDFRRSSDVLEYLNERLSEYASRIADDFAFERIAFIPLRTGTDGKRKYQKRRGKR